MKKLLGMLIAAGVVVCGMTSQASAGTLLGDYLSDSGIDVEVSASLDYYNQYIWRGQRLDGDDVLQPGFAVTIGGFEMGLWGSYDMANKDGLASDEQDAWVAYTYAMDALSITVGHTWYNFSEGGTSSKEVYASIGYDTLLSPTLSVYHDYEDGKAAVSGGNGNYYTFDVSHSLTLMEDAGISLDLAAVVGVYDGQWYDDGVHVTPSIGLTIPLTDNVTISPSVSYNANLSGDIENAVEDEAYFGVSVGFSS